MDTNRESARLTPYAPQRDLYTDTHCCSSGYRSTNILLSQDKSGEFPYLDLLIVAILPLILIGGALL